MVRDQSKSLNPIAELLESFRVLGSYKAEASEHYWGMDFMDEDHDPDFEEMLSDERSMW